MNKVNRNLAIGILFGLYNGGAVYANPAGASYDPSQVSINNINPNTLEITNSDGAIINWQQFSIQENEITRFVQDSTNSAVLNRVIGQDPSSILGQLLSNGRVFLINPNGIIFGPDAVIDTAGLVASTLDMTDEDFIKQNLKFQGENAADITNQGYIKAGENGDIFLIAPNIENSGVIETNGGQILLAAGESITIASLDSDHIIFDVQAPENEVVNLGKIITQGGAASMFAGTIKHSGSISADSINIDKNGNVQLFAKADIEISSDAVITANGARGGEIKIESDTGTVWDAGTLEAKGHASEGGRIEVLGERVALIDAASIDASGKTGGGEVLIGGDYQGKNTEVKNARQTFIGESVSVKADAITNGDGGRVIVWGDETTQVYGDISVRGGAQSGNGGFVETSGKLYLDVTSVPDITAPHGSAGVWLLDPDDIIISTALDNNITGGSPFTHSSTGSSVLNTGTLQTALNAGGTIIVDASSGGSIFVNNTVTKTAGAAATLRLLADNNIDINAIISSSSNILNLDLKADQDTSGGGVINLGANINTNGGMLDTNGGVVNITNNTSLNNTDWTNTGNVNTGAGTVLTFNGGTFDFNSGSSIAGPGDLAFLDGTINFKSGSSYTMSGDTGINGSTVVVNFNDDAFTNTLTHADGQLNGTGVLTTTGWTPTGGSTNINSLILGVGFNGTISTTIFGTGTITNQGSLTLDSATINPNFINSGSMAVVNGTSSLIGTAQQTAGTLKVDSGAVLSSAALNINGGVLHGDGTVSGNLNNNNGVVTAGNVLGTLTVAGAYTQAAGGTLQADLGGATMAGTDYDLLKVTGTASLAGTLDVQLFNGFIGEEGQKFDIIDAASISGDFTTVKTPDTHVFTNSVDVPVPGDYQIEIAAITASSTASDLSSTSVAINTATATATNNVLVLNDFSTELNQDEFTFESNKLGSSEEEGEQEKRTLVCR